MGPKLGRVFPTKIAPKDRLLSMAHDYPGNQRHLIPRFDKAFRLAKSQRLDQARKEQGSRRPLLTRNLSAKLIGSVASSGMPKSVLHKKNGSDFLSVLVTRTKFSKQKKTRLKSHGKRTIDSKNRMGQGKKLALFQNLRKEPLTFLELHRRFGVSKQTLAGLLRNGVLEEVWGKNGIGLKFTITSAGRERLKGLEENARYSPKIRKVGRFRLNQASVP